MLILLHIFYPRSKFYTNWTDNLGPKRERKRESPQDMWHLRLKNLSMTTNQVIVASLVTILMWACVGCSFILTSSHFCLALILSPTNISWWGSRKVDDQLPCRLCHPTHSICHRAWPAHKCKTRASYFQREAYGHCHDAIAAPVT